MEIPQLIFDQWAALQRSRDTLQTLRNRFHHSNADAAAEFTRDYLSSRVFVANDEIHKRRVLNGIETRVTQQRREALRVGLYGVERPLPELGAALSAFKQAARRAPHPLDAWMAVTGGQRKFLDDHTEMLADVAHEQRLTRLWLETANWQPSRWHRDYERAVVDLSDADAVRPAASFVIFAESKLADGWSGPTPVNAAEEQAAVSLRKLIDSTQAARIPDAVAEIEAGIAGIQKIISRVRTLDGVAAANPDRELNAAEAFKAELAAMEAETAAEVA